MKKLLLILIAVIFLTGCTSKVTQDSTSSDGWESCDNYQDIKDFEKPRQVVWLAKMDGCLDSCKGGSFTRTENEVDYPRFAAYTINDEKIPERYKQQDELILEIVGEWVGISDDYYRTVFNHKCVPVVNIKKIMPVSELSDFDKYPVKKEFTGKSAPLNLGSNEIGYRLKTVITEVYKKGPNFADHYTVAYWGCGTACQSFAIVDNFTGLIYWGDNFGSSDGIAFTLDSNLLIVNPPNFVDEVLDHRDITDTEKKESRLKSELFQPSEFYKWEGNKLIFL